MPASGVDAVRSYVDALLRYFEFSGRTGRAQYWLFVLFNIILLVTAMLLDRKLSGADSHRLGVLTLFVIIFHFVPSITTTIRRLHDVGRSGWWYLLGMVPFGGIVLLVWMCSASQEGSNDYGDPDEWLKSSSSRDPAPSRAAGFGFGGGRQLTVAQIEANRGAGRRLAE
jgi:uncharacterized membrane protein YhaH (DUF805 family)